MSVFVSNPRRTFTCPPMDIPVQNNLAITPAQVHALAMQGIPVSTQSSQLHYIDGNFGDDHNLPLSLRRGVDPADLYEQHMNLSKRFGTAWEKHQEKINAERAAQQALDNQVAQDLK